VPGRPCTSRRERMLVRAVLAAAALLVLVAVASLVVSTAPARRGCIDVTIASSLGGQPISGCGARARSLCRQVGLRGGFTAADGAVVAAACRRSGLAVGAALPGRGR
jgi:hypothetical protein